LRILILVSLCAALGGAAQAGPIDWAKHHKRFLLMEGAAVAGASIHAAGLHHCRHTNGVELCDEHYGSAWAMFGVWTGMNTIIFPAVAEGCWRDQQGKFCNIFAYGGSATQGAWGVHEAAIHKKEFPLAAVPK